MMYVRSSGKFFDSSSIFARMRVAHLQGVGVGQLEDDQPADPRPLQRQLRSSFLAPRTTRPTSRMRRMRPSGVVRRMMSANCEGSFSRPSVVRGICDLLPRRHRLLADLSAGHLRVLLPHAATTSPAVRPRAASLLRVDPDPHAGLALPGDEDVADPRQPEQLVADVHQRIVAQVELVVAAVGRYDVDAPTPWQWRMRLESPAPTRLPNRPTAARANGPLPPKSRTPLPGDRGRWRSVTSTGMGFPMLPRAAATRPTAAWPCG